MNILRIKGFIRKDFGMKKKVIEIPDEINCIFQYQSLVCINSKIKNVLLFGCGI